MGCLAEDFWQLHSIDGKFGYSAGGNGLKTYFNGAFAEEGNFVRLLLNSGSTNELRGGVLEARVPFSLNCSSTVNLNGEIAKNKVYR